MLQHSEMKMCYTLVALMMCTILTKSTFLNDHCSYTGLSCLNCTHRKMCIRWIPIYGPIERYGEPTPCSNALTSHSLPYCDPRTNQCVSYVPEQCNKEGSLSCLRDAPGHYYPDITNCKNYYKCDTGKPKLVECPRGLVYKQEWRKCIVNLSSKRDCFKVVNCPSQSQMYPGDSSLYYRCSQANSKVSLLACPSSRDVYDPTSETCHAQQLCGTIPSKLLLPIPYKCSSYYDCSKWEEVQCPNGQGFNQRTRKCTLLYNKLCNEVSLLENNVRALLGGFFLFDFMESVSGLSNFSPYSLILLLPYPESVISTSILVTDYLYKERNIPPGLINYIIELGLSFIPPPVRAIIDMLLNFLPFKLPSSTHLSKDQTIALAIEQEFIRTNFSEVAAALEAINSVPDGFQSFVKHLSDRLNVPQENLYGILQMMVPTLAHTINKLFAIRENTTVLEMDHQELHLNQEWLWRILQGQLENIGHFLGNINEHASQVFRSVVETYVNEGYQFVGKVAQEVYLPLHV